MSGLGKVIGIRKCDNCGIDIEIRHKDRMNRKNVFCCKTCEGEYRKNQSELNVECVVCHKKMHRKPYRLTNVKYPVCSVECHNILNSTIYQKDGNPNYGNRGSKNPIWKSDEKISYYGYRLIRCLDHPFVNCDGFVFEHRLIAEQYLLNDENSVIVNGHKYLSPDYIVHHIDFDRLNNDVENLSVMQLREHTVLHCSLKKDDKKLLEYCNLHSLDIETVRIRMYSNK